MVSTTLQDGHFFSTIFRFDVDHFIDVNVNLEEAVNMEENWTLNIFLKSVKWSNSSRNANINTFLFFLVWTLPIKWLLTVFL